MTEPRKHIAQMDAYALSELVPPEGRELVSLSQNESLRGPSPMAVAAAGAALAESELYPDPDWNNLRAALGSLHGVDPGDILCGGGSLDLISCIARAFSGPDRAVLAPEHSYPFFRSVARMSEARFDTAPESDRTVDVDALLEAVTPDTGLVFVANPGNPTGTRIARSELLRLRDGLRGDILLVVDEAYGEFADAPGEGCFDLAGDRRTIVLRTFSKAYGMAGLRVGWGVFPRAVAAEVRKVMNPNGIASVSQAAAVAALADQAYMRETCRLTSELRDGVRRELEDLGLRVAPSHTNFLLLDFGTPEAAGKADRALRAEGIFLRPQTAAGLPHTLRMTVGPERANAAAISCLAASGKGK